MIQLEKLNDLPYQGFPMGKADITSDEVANAVKQLQTWFSVESSNQPQVSILERHNGYEQYHVAFDRSLRRPNCIPLEKDNPLGQLVDKLAQQILKAGVPITFVGVRFEQGHVRGFAECWHIDEVETVVTIGFSSMKEWNTKIISNQNIQSLSPEVVQDRHSKNEELDKIADSTIDGHFYRGSRVIHRSPTASDIHHPITINDYRLFLRFL